MSGRWLDSVCGDAAKPSHMEREKLAQAEETAPMLRALAWGDSLARITRSEATLEWCDSPPNQNIGKATLE